MGPWKRHTRDVSVEIPAVVRSLFIVDFDILRQEGGVFTELDSQSDLLSLV